MKNSPLFNVYGIPVFFKIGTLYFLNLDDVKSFLKINKNFTFDDIITYEFPIGFPRVVNIKESIKNKNNIIYYEDDEIQYHLSQEKNYEI